VADVTAQHTVTFLPLICSVISLMLWGFSVSHSQALCLRWGVALSLKQILESVFCQLQNIPSCHTQIHNVTLYDLV
jgi:hypothetical protein